MKIIKEKEKIIISHIFLLILCVLRPIIKCDINEIIVITVALIDLGLFLFDKIDYRRRLLLMSVIFVVAAVYSFEFIFCLPPVICLFLSMNSVSRKKIIFFLFFIAVDIVFWIIILSQFMKYTSDYYDGIQLIYLSYLIILELIFVALFVFILKKNNIKFYISEKIRIDKRIKKKKTISKKDEKIVSMYYSIISKIVLYFSNIIFLLNMFIYSLHKFHSDSYCSIQMLLVFIWSFYLVFFVKKEFLKDDYGKCTYVIRKVLTVFSRLTADLRFK